MYVCRYDDGLITGMSLSCRDVDDDDDDKIELGFYNMSSPSLSE